MGYSGDDLRDILCCKIANIYIYISRDMVEQKHVCMCICK